MMSEREKKLLQTIAEAVPQMSDFNKGYLLGMGEAMVNQKKGVNIVGENDNDPGNGVIDQGLQR